VRYRKAVPEARTKYEAERAETEARKAVYEGKYGKEPSNITLKDFIEKVFLPWSKSEKRSWMADDSRAKALIAHFGKKKMREISEIYVAAFKKERLATPTKRGGRTPATVNRELQLLRRVFNLAIERGLIQTNPCKGMKLLHENNIGTRYLTEEEEERLLPFLTGRRKHLLDILTIDHYTGMRRGELLSLNRSQIDLVRNLILLTHTKSGKPRLIPIHPDIRPLIQQLCQQAGPSGYLFEYKDTGKPLKDIKTAWRAALEDAEIPHIPFHCAGRHTFGTRAAAGGANLKDIQEIMGHADINTTMRYVHATEQGKRRAIEAAVKGKSESKPASLLPHKKTATG
jgi:integrase